MFCIRSYLRRHLIFRTKAAAADYPATGQAFAHPFLKMLLSESNATLQSKVGDWAMTEYFVSSGVTSTGVTLNDGDRMDVLGTATSTAINNGGFQVVSYGGIALATTVNTGGFEYVSGGTVSGTVASGGDVSLYSGGTSISTTVARHGVWKHLAFAFRGTMTFTGQDGRDGFVSAPLTGKLEHPIAHFGPSREPGDGIDCQFDFKIAGGAPAPDHPDPRDIMLTTLQHDLIDQAAQ